MKVFLLFAAMSLTGSVYADIFNPSTGKGAYCTDSSGSNHTCGGDVTCNMVEKTCSVGGIPGTLHSGAQAAKKGKR